MVDAGGDAMTAVEVAVMMLMVLLVFLLFV